MFTRIVVPLDGSAVAACALGHAVPLAETLGATMTLVGVAPTQDGVTTADLLGWPGTVRRNDVPGPAAMHAMDYLESAASTLHARGVPCETTVYTGNPAAEIVACAGHDPGTLIAMSTHGRTGYRRWRLGSVAQHVMRHAVVPTLIIPAREGAVTDAHPPVAEITVTLDGSPFAEAALPAAAALADAFGVPLVLLRASHDGSEITPSPWDRYLARVEARMTAPTRSVRTVCRCHIADRAEEVLSGYLAERPAGIVVMASHGRGGIARWAMGSTAEGMMVQSPQPVLVIRAGTALPEATANIPQADQSDRKVPAIAEPGQALAR